MYGSKPWLCPVDFGFGLQRSGENLSRYGIREERQEREEREDSEDREEGKKPMPNANADANANTKDSMYLLYSRMYITLDSFDNMHRWCNGDAEGALNNMSLYMRLRSNEDVCTWETEDSPITTFVASKA